MGQALSDLVGFGKGQLRLNNAALREELQQMKKRQPVYKTVYRDGDNPALMNKINALTNELSRMKQNEENRIPDKQYVYIDNPALARQINALNKQLQSKKDNEQEIRKLSAERQSLMRQNQQEKRQGIKRHNAQKQQLRRQNQKEKQKTQKELDALNAEVYRQRMEQKAIRAKYQANQKQMAAMTQKNAEFRQQLETLTTEYNKNRQKIKSLEDPKKIEENQKKLFVTFLQSLMTFDIYNPIPKDKNLKYVAVIGEISAGKSSIYNWMFGLKLETGQGEVTDKISIIHKDVETANRVYWDSPGLSEETEIIDAKTLRAFYTIDCVFVVTDRSFKNCKKCLQVMNKISPPQLYLVRTKCDLLKSDAELQKVMKQDRDYISSLQINREILYISPHRPDTFRDNLKFKRLISGKLI